MKKKIENFKDIFEYELLTKLDKLDVHTFPTGFRFDSSTDEPGAVPIVISGSIDVSKTDTKGRVYPVYTIKQGECCTIAMDAIIHNSANRGQHGITNSEVETILITAEQSRLWIDEYPSWRKYIFDLYGKRLNELLAQHEVVTEQNSQIIDKTEKINNSIKYASRIQKAVLPTQEYLNNILPEYFVINKPKDIVSGDFYFVEQKDNKLVIIVADSTGHGVPGAFMSMLGISMLNEIINKEKYQGANEILNELRNKIKISLKQTGDLDEQKDGFDMAVCIIDNKQMELEFAGAFNPLYHIRNNKLIEIKADKMPVGIYIKEKVSFTSYKTEIRKDDLIYLFSDGYADQFGYKDDVIQKFQTLNFKKLLIKIHKNDLNKQKKYLLDNFNNWKKDLEQTDDVLLLGVKI